MAKVAKRLVRADDDAWRVVSCPRCSKRVRVLKSDGVAVVRDVLRDCPDHFVTPHSDAPAALTGFYKRLVCTAFIEAMRVEGTQQPYGAGWYPWGDPMVIESDGVLAQYRHWDEAIMARQWFASPAPDPATDPVGYILSFDATCRALRRDPDVERVAALAMIDAVADFDVDEVWERVEFLTANPPDEIKEPLFDAPRSVKALDQGCLFGMGA